MEAMPDWVEQAEKLPLAFAQVREDPLIDEWVVNRLGEGANILLVASGGCTAARLAGNRRVRSLHLVDLNSAQLALSLLKLHLLKHAGCEERLKLLGHSEMDPVDRAKRTGTMLAELRLPADALGSPSVIAESGVDNCGRYERVFSALREELSDCNADLQSVLCLEDIEAQRRRTDTDSLLGQELRRALDAVMALPILVRLFGEKATNNRLQAFAAHFFKRIQHAFSTLPARSNPYLWQMLQGTYSPDRIAPWFGVPPLHRLPEITWSHTFMDEALAAVDRRFDFIQLSNILDWLAPEEARSTLDLAAQALNTGGWILIRQLNSTLEIPQLGPQFRWLTTEADSLHQRDRSFFYRKLHLGVKQ